MRRVSQTHKDRAQADVDRSTNLSLFAGFLGAAFGGAVDLVVPPAGVGVGVVFAAWVAALGRHIVVAQRVVRDPPNPHFQAVTRVRGLRFDVELLTEDDFGRVNAPALEALLRSSSLCAAMIRALERSQGAALAGQSGFEEERFNEAIRFALGLGEALRSFADSTTQVTGAVRELPPVPEVLPRGGRLVDLLSDADLAELYHMGVPRGDLNVAVMERANADPRELFNRGLGDLAEVGRRYSALLVQAPSHAFSGMPGSMSAP